jgi:hypothetical protein
MPINQVADSGLQIWAENEGKGSINNLVIKLQKIPCKERVKKMKDKNLAVYNNHNSIEVK